jgi:nucleoid-associated protein YgaU
MARYIDPPEIDRTASGKRFYTTAVPQDIPLSTFPREYISVLGDRWDSLAFRFYNNAALWYILANANNGVDGSILIKPGTRIIIPEV